MTSEVNFDGLVGPTHHYGGLSAGNLASQLNKLAVSHPRAAALQGLEKMKLLLDLGVPQAILPPHERPHFEFLRESGFTGSEREIIAQAAKARPDLLSIAYSASAMWAANAATVSPSADTQRIHECWPHQGKVCLTVANLISTPHRKLESQFTHTLLKRIFADEARFSIWAPLADEPRFADEGAANHMRLCPSHGEPGIETSVYGLDNYNQNTSAPAPVRYPARQTLAASLAISGRQAQDMTHWLFVRQNPDAIDAGAFHNDVVAVSNENVLFCHSQAWHRQAEFLNSLQRKRDKSFPMELFLIEVPPEELTLEEAVSTYLFNSQIVTLPTAQHPPAPQLSTLNSQRTMLLLAPSECEHHPRARAVIDRVLAEDNPIRQVKFVDVRQSMRNGGGPACLRLRVVLTDEERSALQGNVLLTPELYEQLRAWVTKHYREELSIPELVDPQLITEVRDALDELTEILELPNLYPFQQA